jgi:NitT/TauT family transport system permease protein
VTAVQPATAAPAVGARASGVPRHKSRLFIFLYQVAIGVALILLWQWASGRLISPFWVSSPLEIWRYVVKNTASGSLPFHLYWTVREAVIGFVIGAAAGIVTGFVLARFATLARTLEPFMMAFYGVPRIALAPLFIIWFGIGELSKVVLVVLVVFFLCFMSTYSGVLGVSPELKNVLRVMGGRELQVTTKIVLPAAAPWILSGLKVSVPYAFVGAIVGEFMVSTRGLGFLLQRESNLFNTTGTIAGVLVLALVVVVANTIVGRVERHVLRWRPRDRATGRDVVP